MASHREISFSTAPSKELYRNRNEQDIDTTQRDQQISDAAKMRYGIIESIVSSSSRIKEDSSALTHFLLKRPHNFISSPLQNVGPIPYKKSRSSWWDHFDLIIDSNGTNYIRKCKYCPVTYVHAGGTGNMALHTTKVHQEKIKPSLPSQVKPSNNDSSGISGKIAPRKDFSQILSDDKLVQFIISRNVGLDLVEEESFRQFCLSLNPKFKLPSTIEMGDRVVDSFLKYKKNLISMMSEQDPEKNGKYSFRIDLRTLGKTKSVLIITANWLTEDFKMCEAMLAAREVCIGEQLGHNIACLFLDVLKEYHLENKILSVTTYSTISKSTFIFDLANLTTDQMSNPPFLTGNLINCFTNVINLALNDSLTIARPIINKVKCLMVVAPRINPQEIYEHSNTEYNEKGSEEVDQQHSSSYRDSPELCNSPPISASSSTSWRANLFPLLERSLEMRQELKKLTVMQQELRSIELCENEWDYIEEILNFLRPFTVVMRHVEGLLYPTLNCTLPLYNSLLNMIDELLLDPNKSELIKQAANIAKETISSYYNRTNPLYLIAIIMDPRLKLNYFTSHGWNNSLEGVKTILLAEWEQYKDIGAESSTSITDIPAAGPSCSAIEKRAVVDLDPLFADIYVRKRNLKEKDELDLYLAEEVEDGSVCFQSYWRSKKSVWPRLARMARDYFSPMATSVASERLSTPQCDLIDISLNDELQDSTMESVICLRSWIRSRLLGAN